MPGLAGPTDTITTVRGSFDISKGVLYEKGLAHRSWKRHLL